LQVISLRKAGSHQAELPGQGQAKVAGAGAPAAAATSGPAGFSHKTAPKEGESHTKNAEGEAWKWCGTCKRWNKGEKAHLTDDHVKGKGKPAEVKAETVNAVAAALATNDTGLSLRMISGYMAGPSSHWNLPIATCAITTIATTRSTKLRLFIPSR
jgi:hypothetical protein